jgi:hypothetical protein
MKKGRLLFAAALLALTSALLMSGSLPVVAERGGVSASAGDDGPVVRVVRGYGKEQF